MKNVSSKSHSKSIVVIASHAPSLIIFRLELLKSLVEKNYNVITIAPNFNEHPFVAPTLSRIGIRTIQVKLSRAGLSPISDIVFLFSLIKILKNTQPTHILSYTAKPVIWGILSAKASKVPNRVAMITGLGFGFTEGRGLKRLFTHKVLSFLYYLSLKNATKVLFQNPDDQRYFFDHRLISKKTPTSIINGSGIDTTKFAKKPLPKSKISFLLIARLIADKGVREYAAAAKIIKSRNPEVDFHLAGGRDVNPTGISLDEVRGWHESGTLFWHGEVTDVRPLIQQCHVYVLPSYREGTPRTVLEAMAIGRAIITTDAPGCRETVVPGLNGFLVAVRDVSELVNAMLAFIENPGLAKTMGEESRALVVEKYESKKVVQAIIDKIF